MFKNRYTLLLTFVAFLCVLNQRVYCETVSDQKKPVFFSLYGDSGWALSSFHSSNESLNSQFSPVSSVALGMRANMRICKKVKNHRYAAEDGLFPVHKLCKVLWLWETFAIKPQIRCL